MKRILVFLLLVSLWGIVSTAEAAVSAVKCAITGSGFPFITYNYIGPPLVNGEEESNWKDVPGCADIHVNNEIVGVGKDFQEASRDARRVCAGLRSCYVESCQPYAEAPSQFKKVEAICACTKFLTHADFSVRSCHQLNWIVREGSDIFSAFYNVWSACRGDEVAPLILLTGGDGMLIHDCTFSFLE